MGCVQEFFSASPRRGKTPRTRMTKFAWVEGTKQIQLACSPYCASPRRSGLQSRVFVCLVNLCSPHVRHLPQVVIAQIFIRSWSRPSRGAPPYSQIRLTLYTTAKRSAIGGKLLKNNAFFTLKTLKMGAFQRQKRPKTTFFGAFSHSL